MTERKLSVFLCHSSQDKPIVRDLYQRLAGESWIDPWLDEEKLLPGQDWDMEIEKAVESADVVIVCISSHSVSKEGYVQRELKFVLDIALEKPEGTIFVIPLRLDDCVVPRRLRSWQYVDYFPVDQRKRASQRLIQALQARHGQLAAIEPEIQVTPGTRTETSATNPAERTREDVKRDAPIHADMFSMTPLDIGGSIVQIVFFALAALDAFDLTDSDMMVALGVCGIVSGGYLLYKRQRVPDTLFRFLTVFFVAIHMFVVYGESTGWDMPFALYIVQGLSALAVGGLLIMNFRSPRKQAIYSSILLGLFLISFGIKWVANGFGVHPPALYTPIILTGIVSAILVSLDL